MSQADLAAKLDVSTGTVAAWELEKKGRKKKGHGFRIDRLPDIANALDMTVDELVKAAS